jgi:signal transduction histidine kinase
LSQIIENLLDFSRLKRKEEALPLEPVDLEALLRQVAEGFSHRTGEGAIDFQVERVDPVVLKTNAAAVERILANLLDNALKYGDGERPWIRLRGETGGGEVRISVSDNGVGIPRRDRERVFEEFYRVRYDDYAVQGSGLGLSIARRLARLLGGDLRFESIEGSGSTFVLVLPGEEAA